MTDFEETVWGDVINYAIDDGMVYNAAASTSGKGYCSNNSSLVKESGCRNLEYGKSLTFNSGAYKRSGGFSNLASGRITKTMYDNLHGVIVCNVRRNDITRNSELKVQISLTSMCKMAMQLDVFVEYERSCMIDLITGKIYDIV
jgi:hypothetical protein